MKSLGWSCSRFLRVFRYAFIPSLTMRGGQGGSSADELRIPLVLELRSPPAPGLLKTWPGSISRFPSVLLRDSSLLIHLNKESQESRRPENPEVREHFG